MFAPESGVKVFFTLSKYKQKSRHILVLVVSGKAATWYKDFI